MQILIALISILYIIFHTIHIIISTAISSRKAMKKARAKNKEMVELVSNLTLESTVKVKGILMESPKVKLNGMEIIPEKIEVTSRSEEELPFN